LSFVAAVPATVTSWRRLAHKNGTDIHKSTALQAPLRELELAPEVPGRTDSPVGSSWFLATRTARIYPMVSKSAAVEYASHCSRGGPCGLSPMAPNDDTKRGETHPPTLREKYCV